MPPRLLALLGLAVAALCAAPTALAAGPGTWDRVTATDGVNIDEVATARDGGGTLHVLWLRKTPGTPSNDDLVHTPIAASGALGAPVVVQAGWAAISKPDAVVLPGGALLAVFGGIRTIDPGETQTNASAVVSTDGGASWSLQPGDTISSGSAYAGDMGAAVDAAGVPYSAWGVTYGLFVHRGLSAATPNFDFQPPVGGCCGYDPGLALDGANGQLWVAWYSNATNGTGVWANRVDTGSGAPAGPPVRMPGSATQYGGRLESSSMMERTPITGRPGRAGVYVAYPAGYPSYDRVLLWRIGDAGARTIAKVKSGLRFVNVAADPGGRLWVVWSRMVGSSPRVYARRSDPQAHTFGSTVSARAPKGADAVWKLDADAQGGALDVLGSFSTPGSLATWHSQLRPGLTLSAKPTKVKLHHKAKIHFTVRDAGDAVKGAKVKVAGHSATTDAKGRASITIGPYASRHRLHASARRTGFTTAKRTIRVG